MALPSAAVLAEAVWVAVDRQVWLVGHIRHLVDLLAVTVLAGVTAMLPALWQRDRTHLTATYAVALTVGIAGAGALEALQWVLLQV